MNAAMQTAGYTNDQTKLNATITLRWGLCRNNDPITKPDFRFYHPMERQSPNSHTKEPKKRNHTHYSYKKATGKWSGKRIKDNFTARFTGKAKERNWRPIIDLCQ